MDWKNKLNNNPSLRIIQEQAKTAAEEIREARAELEPKYFEAMLLGVHLSSALSREGKTAGAVRELERVKLTVDRNMLDWCVIEVDTDIESIRGKQLVLPSFIVYTLLAPYLTDNKLNKTPAGIIVPKNTELVVPAAPEEGTEAVTADVTTEDQTEGALV